MKINVTFTITTFKTTNSFFRGGLMSRKIIEQANQAISAEIELQDCYRRMESQVTNPKVKAVLHDLLLMEEMNEVLLRSLNRKLMA